MNLQTLLVVVLRLIALNFLLQVAVQLTPQILQFLRLLDPSPLDGSRSFSVLPWLILIGLITAALLLWFLALPIARFVTRGVPQELSFGNLSLIDCYSIAFMAIGLLYIVRHLPQILNWLHYFITSAGSDPSGAWKEGLSWYDVSNAFIPFIVGVVLFVKGRHWAMVLARREELPSPVGESGTEE